MKPSRQWTIVGGVVLVAAVALVVATRSMGDQLAQVVAGSNAPDFHAVHVSQAAGQPLEPRSLADYKGKVVLLNIWATWCNPCRAEMPSIERLHQELGPEGLKVIAMSVDNPGMEDEIRSFAKEYRLSFELLYDAKGNIRTDYQTTGVPETFLIGKDGVIRKRVIAATDWNAAPEKALIRQLLSEPSP